MDFQVTPKFTRRELELQCSAAVAPAAGSMFEIDIGGRKEAAPFNGASATATIPLADLQALPVIPHSLRVLSGGQVIQLPNVPILDKCDIRDTEQFIERVQALRKRIEDPEAVRFCSRRMLTKPGSAMNLRAAALCAIGYRIVEGLDAKDADLEPYWAWVEDFLAEVGTSDDLVRWTTSVTMCSVYVAILQRDAQKTLRFLSKTLSYRSYLPQLSLLHTNFSRCSALLALLEMARRDRAQADMLLSDVGEIFRVGARSSWIDHPVRGRNQYSEVLAVLKSYRVAAEIQRAARETKGDEALNKLAMSTQIAPISNVTRRLEEEGHWLAVLSSAAGSSQKVEAPAAKPKPGKRPPPAVSPVALAALPDMLKAALAPGGDMSAGFRNGVATLAAGAFKAAASDDFEFRIRHEADLNRLMRLDGSVRAERQFFWAALLDLSRVRYRFAYLALAAGDRDGAFALLTATTQWSKLVLSSASIDTDADFDYALLFVPVTLITYLTAHRYVVPEERHLTDRGIQPEFVKSFERSFRDPGLLERVARLLNFEAAVAV